MASARKNLCAALKIDCFAPKPVPEKEEAPDLEAGGDEELDYKQETTTPVAEPRPPASLRRSPSDEPYLEPRDDDAPQPTRAFAYSVQAAKGHRPYMEDENDIARDGRFAAVYDGHGGAGVSRYLHNELFTQTRLALASEAEREEARAQRHKLRLRRRGADRGAEGRKDVVLRVPKGPAAVPHTPACLRA